MYNVGAWLNFPMVNLLMNYNAKRQRVQAPDARSFGGQDPDHIKRIVRDIDDIFSGLDGDYNAVMEMYGGDTLETAEVLTSGMPTRFS